MKKILIILVIMLGSLETQAQKISLLYQGIYFGLRMSNGKLPDYQMSDFEI